MDVKIKVKDLNIESSPLLTDYAINERPGGTGIQPKLVTWQDILTLFIANSLSTTGESGIIPAGANQATATVLTSSKNRVDTVTAGTGVKDDIAPTVGFTRLIQNNGANDLNYYPFLGARFYAVGTGLMAINSPVVIAPGNQVEVYCYDDGVLTFI